MNKLLDAEDILTFARDHIECVFMAAGQLPREEGDPIQVVADTGSKKNRGGDRVAERISRVRGLRWACSIREIFVALGTPRQPSLTALDWGDRGQDWGRA